MIDPKARRDLVAQVVAEVVKEVEAESPPSPAKLKDEAPQWSRGPKHRPLPPPRQPEVVEALKATTPSRIITGRTGTRYLTASYLGLRADHAIAIDAVAAFIKRVLPRLTPA